MEHARRRRPSAYDDYIEGNLLLLLLQLVGGTGGHDVVPYGSPNRTDQKEMEIGLEKGNRSWKSKKWINLWSFMQ